MSQLLLDNLSSICSLTTVELLLCSQTDMHILVLSPLLVFFYLLVFIFLLLHFYKVKQMTLSSQKVLNNLILVRALSGPLIYAIYFLTTQLASDYKRPGECNYP